jgi:hypothetical protein
MTGLPTEFELAKLESPLTLSMFRAMYIKEHNKTMEEMMTKKD